MVLEEASTSESAFASDTPSSDVDPYESSSSSSSPGPAANGADGPAEYRVDMSKLPKPLPLLGSLFGFSEQKLLRIIALDAGRCRALVGRPLTQPEMDAISYHCARMNAISSYGGPVGVLGGVWRAQNSKDTFRFPFWQPTYKPDAPIEKGMFDPKKFGPLRGMAAEAAWHAMRRTAYALIGGSVGMAVIGAYATSVAVAGQTQDRRMQDIATAIKRMTPEERRFRLEQGSREVRDSMRPPRQPMQQRGYEDGATTSGAAPVAYTPGNAPSSDRQGQAAQSAQYPAQRQPQYRQAEAQSSSFDFDDASPQAPQYSSAQSQGDSWERLRQNARNGVSYQSSQPQDAGSVWADRRRSPQQGPSGEQAQGSTLGDAFSFSKTDEERQLAQGEAQREFDARVERERQGQDFGSDSDRRWR